MAMTVMSVFSPAEQARFRGQEPAQARDPLARASKVRSIIAAATLLAMCLLSACAPQGALSPAASKAQWDEQIRLAWTALRQADFSNASHHFELALDISKTIDDEGLLRAASEAGLASVYQATGRYAAAETMYHKALASYDALRATSDILIQIGVHGELSRLYRDLAGLYRLQGRRQQAEQMYRDGLLEWQSSKAYAEQFPSFGRRPPRPNNFGPTVRVANQLHAWASVYHFLGQHEEAMRHYQRALAAVDWSGSGRPLIAASVPFLQGLVGMGELHAQMGQAAEAESRYRQALALYELGYAKNAPFVATTLTKLARLYEHPDTREDAKGLYTDALRIYTQSLGRDHPSVASTHHALAGLHDAMGQRKQALTHARRTTDIYRTRAVSINAARSLADITEQQGARPLFARHVSLLSKANALDTAELVAESYAVAQLALATGADRAIAQMAARFAGRDDRLAPIVRKRQETLNRRWATDSALIRLLSQSPTERDAKSVQALRDEVEALDRTLAQLDATVASEFPEYRDLTTAEPLSVEETRALLGPSEALLVYLVEQDASYLWVITRSIVRSFRLEIGSDALERKVQRVRQQLDPLRITDLRIDAQVFHEIYAAILSPAAEHLSGIDHLLIVPDGALQGLPFSVLLTEPPSGESVADARELSWLVQRHASTVLPSPAALQALRRVARSSPAAEPFVGFGDPLLEGGEDGPRSADLAALFPRGPVADTTAVRKLARLPETADELHAIAAALRATSDDVYVGEHATESLVKFMDLSRFRVVAFSTHGLLAQEASEFAGLAEPALVLTPPPVGSTQDDGLLTASEVAQLELNADWVVLAACSTAAADDGTPGAEGLSGLAQSFFYAGARSLLVSHWTIESRYSLDLIKGVFSQLSADSTLGRAQALRRAMLALMNDRTRPEYAHPVYWAPFVIVGEGGSAG